MGLSQDQFEKYYRIVTGVAILRFENKTYFVKDIVPSEMYRTESYYQQTHEEALQAGALTKEELEALLVERGVYPKGYESQKEILKEHITSLRKQLKQYEFQSLKKATCLEQIEIFKNKLNKLSELRNTLQTLNADYIALIERYKHLVYLNTFSEFECLNRIWPSFNFFYTSSEILVNFLVREAYFDNGIDETLIRAIARNDPWRSIWLGACKTGGLFGAKPFAEITDYQRALVSWSVVYDNVYESMDCPSSEVINNDEALDAWLEEQSEKRRRDKGQGPDIKGNAQEVFIPVDTPEDAKRVYALNDKMTQSVLVNRDKVLQEKGSLRESELPDVKYDLKLKRNELASKAHRK